MENNKKNCDLDLSDLNEDVINIINQFLTFRDVVKFHHIIKIHRCNKN